MKTFTHMPVPHPNARQLPCQKPQIPTTSPHRHLSILPLCSFTLRPFSAQASASCLCSRKIWIAQSFSSSSDWPSCSTTLAVVFGYLQLPPRRPLTHLAIDPLHQRLAITSDFHLDFFALSWYFKNHTLGFLQGTPVTFFRDVLLVSLSFWRGLQSLHPSWADSSSFPEPSPSLEAPFMCPCQNVHGIKPHTHSTPGPPPCQSPPSQNQ